jgi:hypothetical protein
MMGIADFRAADGTLIFQTVSPDPALSIRLERTRARRYAVAVVRMKLTGTADNPGSIQLFWTMTAGIPTEATSVKMPLIPDGKFHEYELPLGKNPRWRGRITSLRLDPCSARGLTVTIDSVVLK